MSSNAYLIDMSQFCMKLQFLSKVKGPMLQTIDDLTKVAPLSFENCKRNAQLPQDFLAECSKSFKKTGTTIMGLTFKGGVILAADTRSTGGPVVMNKNKKKLVCINEQMYMAGAGTAADTAAVGRMAASSLRLHAYKTGRKPLVQSAVKLISDHLFRYMGYVSAYVIIAGVDYKGAHLCSIDAHGSITAQPFVTDGSGRLAAQSMLEKHWKPDMEENDAVECACKAVEAGVFNDLGSGSGVDLVILRLDGTSELKHCICESGSHSGSAPTGVYY